MGNAHVEATPQTNVVCSVRQLKIDGFSSTTASCTGAGDHIKMMSGAPWNVGGYEWEVRCYPARVSSVPACGEWVGLTLVLLGGDELGKLAVMATLGCRLVHPAGALRQSDEKVVSRTFTRRRSESAPVVLARRCRLEEKGYLVDDSVTVQCTITVIKEKEITEA